jgi:hypothetical protein
VNDPKKPPPILYGPDNKPLPLSEDTGVARKKRKAAPRPAKKNKLPAIRFHIAIGKVVVYVLGICATLIGIWSAYPKLAVAPGDVWNNKDPLSIPLTISNNGQFEIYSAHLRCQVDYVWNTTESMGFSSLNLVEPDDLPIGELAGGGYTTTFCNNPLRIMGPGDQLAAQVVLVISFRPSFWPWRIERNFYLRGTSDGNGKVRWIITSKFPLHRNGIEQRKPQR